MLKNNAKFQPGFLLIEIMLFLALATTIMVITLPIVFSSQIIVTDAIIKTQALTAVKAVAEKVEAVGFNYSLEASVNLDNIFLQQSYTWLADYAKNFTALASYSLSGQTKSVNLESLLISNQNLYGRDTCNLFFSGNWQNLNLKGQINLSLSNPSTDIDVNNNILFIAANSTTPSLEDLWSYNVSNLESPSLNAKLNTGPGLSAIRLVKDYIFAANDGTTDQLQIIKIFESNNFGSIIKIKVPNFNGQVSDGRGVSIFYYDNKIFLGLTKNNGPELHIYDVSNPQFPVWIGAFETNTAVNGIYVFNNIAYLSLADGKLLTVLDVSNPAHITEINFFSPIGSGSQSGQSVVGLGENVFLGRAGGLPALGYKELFILNKNNLTLPQVEHDLNASVRKMFVRNGLLFLATNEANKEFQVFTFGSNFINFLSGQDLSAGATALDCEGENFFVSQEDGKVQIISSGS
jgi:competence protein ComGC